MTQFPIHGGPPKTECERNGEHWGDVHHGTWTCCGDPDD